ncbi:MAG: hypothetical protein SFV53_01190 [Rickettsiales bacterium]|nr:hypothetical protein [Rickettsiales bacterium]
MVKANIAALEFVVKNTIGYRDDPRNEDGVDKKIIFKGYTASGLDLSDQEQRELALKTYQVVRDKIKLTILKLEEKLPEDEKLEESLKIINDLLSNRALSPVRSGSPYSNSNLEYNFEQLKLSENNPAINQVVAKSTPPIVKAPSTSPAISSVVKVSADQQNKLL